MKTAKDLKNEKKEAERAAKAEEAKKQDDPEFYFKWIGAKDGDTHAVAFGALAELTACARGSAVLAKETCTRGSAAWQQ